MNNDQFIAMPYQRSLAFCVACWFAIPAFSQITLPGAFVNLINDLGIELLLPVDAGYKRIDVLQSDFQPCQLAIYSRKEKLEIRYLVEPFDSNSQAPQLPHIYASRLLLHLASNDDDAVIAGHSLSPETLENAGADWGKTFFFKPKTAFSNRQHCQLTALQKHQKGTVYIFLLFDDPNNPNLAIRENTIFFKDE